MRQLIFVLLLGLVACSDKHTLPKDVIVPVSMQKIVWDMLQADEVALQNKLKDTTIVLKNESFKLYDKVFAIHKVSRDQFYKSYEYYQKHPHLYKALMEGVKSIAQKEREKALTPEKP
jgi:hypothetical protein